MFTNSMVNLFKNCLRGRKNDQSGSEKEPKQRVDFKERLANLDFFLLDNSIRESTVGQIRSHTLENKQKIFQQVERCGINNRIVASFAHAARVDDSFCEWLQDQRYDFDKLWSFSEITEGIQNGRMDTESIPISLLKNKKYGLYNTLFEFDLINDDLDWGKKWKIQDTFDLIVKWMNWIYDEINEKAKIMINFRDFPDVMEKHPERVLYIVKALSEMHIEKRMFGIAFEDPNGENLPSELGAWTSIIRKTMTDNGWLDGKLIVHIHEKWELMTAAQLEVLYAGGDGIWAGLCAEGAAMGHASSTITITNLIRLGNRKVLKEYNCEAFREAAIEVTKLTTGKMPHPKQCIYGARALDVVFGFVGMGEFDLSKFFNSKPIIRMSTMATKEMIRNHLNSCFGEDEAHSLDICQQMKELMLEDLKSGRKEEYQSEAGAALLFDRGGGVMTQNMVDAINAVEIKNDYHKILIDEIKSIWNNWTKTEEDGDDSLNFDTFYHGFLSPYLGCYRCPDTKKHFKEALGDLDVNDNGQVDWDEFLVYIKWALSQYPNTETADEVLEIVFEKGILPAIRDARMSNQN